MKVTHINSSTKFRSLEIGDVFCAGVFPLCIKVTWTEGSDSTNTIYYDYDHDRWQVANLSGDEIVIKITSAQLTY